MKVLFLGNGKEHALLSENILKNLKCEIAFSHNKADRYNNYNLDYDLGICFMYSFLIPPDAIDKAVWINFHSAPLPECGGINTGYYSIMNGANRFGATIHYMDKTFDTGDIIEVKHFKITDSDTTFDIRRKSCDLLVELFNYYVPLLINGEKIIGTKQKNTKYYKKTEISKYIDLDNNIKKEIRAKYYPPYFPKIRIGNNIYNIIKDTDYDYLK